VKCGASRESVEASMTQNTPPADPTSVAPTPAFQPQEPVSNQPDFAQSPPQPVQTQQYSPPPVPPAGPPQGYAPPPYPSQPGASPYGGQYNTQPQNKTGSGGAIASLVLGIFGVFAWLIPLIGYPVTIIGLILGIKGRKSDKRGMATAGMVLSIIFLVLSIINSAIGAYMGATGQLLY